MTTRKIDIYLNGAYMCSTDQAKTCKEAIERIRMKVANVPGLSVASIPHKSYEIKQTDTLRASYASKKATPHPLAVLRRITKENIDRGLGPIVEIKP